MSSGRNVSPDAGNSSDRRSFSSPYYTNEDIEILHEIVLRAQELLPNLPERERLPTNALFGAYYEILPRLGLKADHDNRYARILFKIGGIGGAATLYERFEAILSRMGIEIEFDQIEEDLYNPSNESIPNVDITTEEEQPRTQRRRNSESTYWDVEQKTPQHAGFRRHNSLSVLVEPSTTPHPNRLKSLAQGGHPSRSRNRLRDKADNDEIADLPQHNVRAWLASRPGESRGGRERSISAHGSMRIRRGSHSYILDGQASTRNRSLSDDFPAPSELTAITSAQDDPAQNRSSDQTLIELMNIKALIFRQQRMRTLSTRITALWRDTSLNVRVNKLSLESLAEKQFRRVVLGKIFGKWHNQMVKYRWEPPAAISTVQFYRQLEEVTEQVRASILLAKAFSHWALVTGDGVERSIVAREHMIRWRTFNSWKNLTVSKELSVRRHVARKFLTLWRDRCEEISIHDGTALLKYEGKLVERIFKQWLQNSHKLQATNWWSARLKWKYIQSWRGTLQILHGQEIAASDQRNFQLVSNKWSLFREKLKGLRQQEQQAVTFQQTHACASALQKWRRETRTLPPRITLEEDLKTHLLRQTFVKWMNRSRQERFAVALDRSKIVREAITSWQYQLRLKLIRQLDDDRVKKHVLGNWVLAERASLAGRIYDLRLKRKYLRKWVEKWKNARKERVTLEERAEAFATRKAGSLVLRRWDARTKMLHERENVAFGFYEPKILDATVHEWKARFEHVQKLQHWSQDAEFYFRTSRALRLWKATTESRKREKRKAAYVQVRRTVKLNLARAVILSWRQQAQEITRMTVQAVEVKQNRNMVISMDLFDQWRARTEEIAEMESICQETVINKQLVRWRAHSTAFRDLELEAIISFQERQLIRAIRTWSLQALQQRSRAQTAADFRSKHNKRTFRRTFVYWHQRTPFTRREEPLEQLGNTSRAEAWSDLGDEGGVADGPPSTPLPGYLSTPSKRSERVTAAATRYLSTTPKAPLSTPFERQLRTQYSGSKLIKSARKGPGRSRLVLEEGFADV